MRIVELVIAGVFAALGVRSVVHWVRRPFEGRTAAEHALFASHVTARAGGWFALAVLFALYATVATTDPITGQRIVARGRAFVDASREYAWLYLVILVFGAVQFATGWFLGRGRTARSS